MNSADNALPRVPQSVSRAKASTPRCATSAAGITCAVLAIGLAAFHWYHDHVVSGAP